MCFFCFFEEISLLHPVFHWFIRAYITTAECFKIASVNVYMLDVTNTQAYSKSTQVYSTPTIQTLNNKQLQWFHSVPFEWMLFTLVCFLLLMLTFLFFLFMSDLSYTTNAIALHRCDIMKWIKALECAKH